MTDTILLDTHIALWLGNGDERLRPSTLRAIDTCHQRGGTILVSAISAREIAQLVSVGRIELAFPPDVWFERLLDRPGIEAVPLTHRAAARAYRLHDFPHRDPADLLLVATAIELACPLITYDRRIAGFASSHGHRHGLQIGS